LTLDYPSISRRIRVFAEKAACFFEDDSARQKRPCFSEDVTLRGVLMASRCVGHYGRPGAHRERGRGLSRAKRSIFWLTAKS
jgi:hypothetical protein